jgi:outer membrane protein assembly factor BamB
VVCDDVCPIATDDERAYVVVSSPSGERVRALDVATGQVRWEHGFAAGVGGIERLPSVVVVDGVGARPAGAGGPADVGRTVALDPSTGEELWARPGILTEAVGRDHLIIDLMSGTMDARVSTMTVVEAATGREVFARTAPSVEMYLHGCGDAGVVLASEGERLTALEVADGAERWSIDAPHLDAFVPVRCDASRVAFLQGDTLRLLDIGSGEEVASRVVVFDVENPVEVLAITGGVVVVGSVDGVNAYESAGLRPGWGWRCLACGPELPVGSIEDRVAVVMGGELVVHSLAGDDRRPEPQRLRLPGLTDKQVVGGTLVAWDAQRLLAVRVDALDAAVQAEVDGVRSAAAGSSHVVVATRDAVRAYPLASEG